MSNPNLYKDEMNRVYKVEGGGGGGIRYVECHSNTDYSSFQCELSAQQIIELYNNGISIVLKVIGDDNPLTVFLCPAVYFPATAPITNVDQLTFVTSSYDINSETLTYIEVLFSSDGNITTHIKEKVFSETVA